VLRTTGRRKTTRSTALMAGMLLAACTVGGCSAFEADRAKPPTAASASPAPSVRESGPTPDGVAAAAAEFGAADDFVSEYARFSRDHTDLMPPGRTFAVPDPSQWPVDTQFETGAGAVSAAFALQCAWLGAYEAARGDDDRRAALDALEQWIDLPDVIRHTDQESRDRWLSDILRPAGEGDDSILLNFAAGCTS
jgi:hypothetical protein